MKKLFVLPVIGVLALVAVVGGVSVARADHGGEGASAITDRIAEILGIAPDEVASAVTQARSEARVARMESRLAEAVADGVITEAEAAAILDWRAGKPDALHSVQHHGLRSAVEAGELETFLAGLVAEEIITVTESAEISAWLELRPPAIEQFRDWRKSQFKNGHHRFHGHKRWGRGHGGCGGHKFIEPEDTPDPDISTSTSL
jgi:hypothetical protein